MEKSNRTIWDEWEIAAIKYLQKHNYQILTTNYQIKWWEIDIIAKDNNQVVIIEVKYRRWTKFWTPEDAFTKMKRKNLLYTTNYYCLTNKIDISNIRVDFLAITNDEKNYQVKHYKNIALQ